MMYGYPGGMMGGYGILGWVLMLFFWALFIGGVVLLIVWAVRGGRHAAAPGPGMQAPGPQPDAALEIARRRLAAGEITPEEYEKIRKTLQGG